MDIIFNIYELFMCITYYIYCLVMGIIFNIYQIFVIYITDIRSNELRVFHLIFII